VNRPNKLSLCRETVRELSNAESALVAGGAAALSNCPCAILSIGYVESGCCIVSYGPGICNTGQGCVHIPPSA
jgi:hypothetical protein